MSEFLSAATSLAAGLPWLGGNLRPAALRGLPFYVQTSEDEPARRWVTHEFPGRDDPWHEDLGAKARAFSIEGLLIGADVVLQAKAFSAAAARAEPATLLHPWYGAMEVVVLDCRVRHDVNEARVARVTLRVEKAGRRPAPLLTTDGLGQVIAEADRLITTAQEGYARLRAMVGAVDFVVASVRGVVTGVAGAVQGALGGAGLLSALLGSVGSAIGALTSASDADITSDTAVPAKIATALREVSALAGGRAAIPTQDSAIDPAPRATFAALLALTDTPVPAAEAAPTTPSRLQLATATDGLGVLTQALVAGELARAASAVSWPSRDEAMAARDLVVDALALAADRAADAGWDDTWRRLVALRAASASDLAARAAPLPRIRRMELPTVLPATLIAYRLDGDRLADLFGRGAALAERNRVRHPGFVPAGTPIEVLV
jgi:prophage DNA circulation protein